MNNYPLSTAQQNIWNLQKYYPYTAISNISGAVFYNDSRDVILLKSALNAVLCAHSALRLRFIEENGEPVQMVSDYHFEDISVCTFSTWEEYDSFAKEQAQIPIALTGDKMYRFQICVVENRVGILVVLNHLIADAWSFSLIIDQVEEAYHNLRQGAEAGLVQRDYIEYVLAGQDYTYSERYAKDAAFFRKHYQEKPERTPVKTENGQNQMIHAGRLIQRLPEALAEKINLYSEKHSVSTAVLFEVATILYLSKINPTNRHITIGLPVLNRSNKNEKKTCGMFISTMPLTVEVTRQETIAELLERIVIGKRELFRHQKYPYAEILKQVREKRGGEGNLYDVMVSVQNARMDAQIDADTYWYGNGFSEIPLAIHIDNRDGKESPVMTIDYQQELFPQRAEAELFARRLLFVLEQMVANDAGTLRSVSLIPDMEKNLLLKKFNDTHAEYAKDKCVHELFTQQVEKTPNKIALVFEDKQFTYRQLDEMSNSLAHYLREKGVGRGDIVSVISKRSWHVIVAMLGVLKAGGTYMPVSPEYPAERIRTMLEISESKMALCYGYDGERISLPCVDMGLLDYERNTEAVENWNKAEDLCYVIFTSGSTGVPKGVSLTHRNIINHFYNNDFIRAMSKCGAMLCVSNIIFDMFINETLCAFFYGFKCVLTDEDETLSGEKLGCIITDQNIETMICTPSKFGAYLTIPKFSSAIKNLKVITFGGEAFTYELYEKIKSYSQTKIYNGYGPTETTIVVSYGEVTGDDITIGHPIANTQIYIVDEKQQLLPIGVAGELCVAGDCVGKGYLNQPELTAERFVPNPFATEENGHGAVLYRTGDLARWRADGEIEYLGRIDTQVKIRGLRIELGEIESVMSSFAGIGLTAVTARKDEHGRQYLVGYYTSEQPIEEKALRTHLSAKLPKYMVPNYFMRLEAMPMTPSGKTDRKNLPSLDFSLRTEEYVAPETDLEKLLAELWMKQLGIKQVGRTDDFFELGGDSLLAISLATELEKRFEISVLAEQIFRYPVLEQMAEKLAESMEESGGKAVCRIVPKHSDRFQLLPQQSAIYAACMRAPGSLLYNIPTKLSLSAEIDREKLKESIRKVVRRHKILNCSIRQIEGKLWAVYDENAEFVFEEYTEKDCQGEHAAQAFFRPFMLDKAPLIRAGFTETELLFDLHHIVADGTSLKQLLQEIAEEYSSEKVAESLQENRAGLWYGDYAEYFHNLDLSAHVAFFREHLKTDFEPVALPETKTGKTGGISAFYDIPEELFYQAKDYAKRQGLTETMLFLGTFGIMLSKYSGKKEVLSSIILQNRTHAETADMVGMFVNTLPVCFEIKGSIGDYFAAVKEYVLGLFRYQEIPRALIAEELGMNKNAVNTSFVYQTDDYRQVHLGTSELSAEWVETGSSKFDLSYEIIPKERGCRIRIEYDQAKYESGLIDSMAEAYQRILAQITCGVHEWEKRATLKDVGTIEVLSEQERYRIVEQFNDTKVNYSKDKCVHELFVEQVRKTPDKIALVFEDKQFTYRELDEMSNSLAYYLREKGIGRGDIVPIFAKRSWHVIMAMLGVLKTGGAYMPILPDYPIERICAMLNIAKCKIILCHNAENTRVPLPQIDISHFDFDSHKNMLDLTIDSSSVCYVLFTSGSTGSPKGVQIAHKGLMNFFSVNRSNQWQTVVNNKGKVVLAHTSLSFDISIFEILIGLLNGLKVVLTEDGESAKSIAKDIRNNGVDVLHITPTKLKMLMQDSDFLGALSKVKYIMCGAEAFTPDLYDQIMKHSKAVVFNGYGPTETTIGVTFKKIEGSSTDITIGKPIANTQIYILDENQHLLPIGVAGELCIAGDGVGKGYLNQPELTAERFVPNPFATEENGHGAVLYRTGDLARWRVDGEIEYLGRIDTQVKIRGLRIELGEIESVMSSFPGIGLVAASAQKDKQGRQYLVGYYTSEQSVEEKALRTHLSAKLPKYMVPNYFMQLEALPMTPSGKTDRKNLPQPDFTARTEEYVAPETGEEKMLCQLMAEALSVEQVGVTDDFFELGGDSLGAIAFVAKAQDAGIELGLQTIFDYPTVRGLCEWLIKRNSTDGNVLNTTHLADAYFDLKKDELRFAELLKNNIIDEDCVFEKKPLRNVFLTGATGFLGAHVLDELMKQETGKIYCLVRSEKEDDRRGRLAQTLRYYFGDLYESEIGSRIIPVVGNIEREELADHMPTDVQTVIHVAATVKHYGAYSYFYKVNVEGTRHVADYAKRIGATLLHVSTISVSGNSLVDAFDVYHSEQELHFSEQDFYIGQPLDNVYVRSKFEAEKLILDQVKAGELSAKIIRVGNLTNRARDFKFQPNFESNAFLKRMKAVLELKLLPDYLMPLYSEFSPVDLTAEGIVKIAEHAGVKQTVFHLYSNKPLYFERMLEIFAGLGVDMKVVDRQEFYEAVRATMKQAGREFIYKTLQGDMDRNGRLLYDSNIHIENGFTTWFMKKVGFEWNEIDERYVKGYLEYFRELGYLE